MFSRFFLVGRRGVLPRRMLDYWNYWGLGYITGSFFVPKIVYYRVPGSYWTFESEIVMPTMRHGRRFLLLTSKLRAILR